MELIALTCWLNDSAGWDDGFGDSACWDNGYDDSAGWDENLRIGRGKSHQRKSLNCNHVCQLLTSWGSH